MDYDASFPGMADLYPFIFNASQFEIFTYSEISASK
jgi:hypothetical protein